MRPTRNSRLQADQGAEIVMAPTLKDAYRKVHGLYGQDAVILGTRTIALRSDNGLGQERMVEVTVGQSEGAQMTGGRPLTGYGAYQAMAESGENGRQSDKRMPPVILAQLDRIDTLVADLTDRMNKLPQASAVMPPGTLGNLLTRAGTRPDTVARLLTRFAAETGQSPDDRPQVIAWLAKQIPAADCGWEGFFGCHAFLGYSRAARLDLVLQAGARFRKLGRQTLVLVMHPEHDGIVHRLQAEASKLGFDAAIMRREDQLTTLQQHFDQYDVVLLELPDLDSPEMAPDGPLHDWLASSAGFHRHLVLPLDGDLDDLDSAGDDARHWNCDWLALTTNTRVRRPGKLLDMIDKVPLPVSLVVDPAEAESSPAIATAGELLDGILKAGNVPTTGSLVDAGLDTAGRSG